MNMTDINNDKDHLLILFTERGIDEIRENYGSIEKLPKETLGKIKALAYSFSKSIINKNTAKDIGVVFSNTKQTLFNRAKKILKGYEKELAIPMTRDEYETADDYLEAIGSPMGLPVWIKLGVCSSWEYK